MTSKSRHFSVVFLLVVLAGVSTSRASAQVAVQSYQGHDAVANEVLIKFQQVPPDDATAQAEMAADIRQAKATGDIDVAQAVGSAGWMRFHSASYDAATLMTVLTGAAGVANVEPNWIYHITSTPNDPHFAQEWGLQNTGQNIQGVAGTPGADIGAVSAWNISTGSSAIAVGVLDTGVDYAHPDLTGNIWSAPYQFSFLQGTTGYTCAAGTHGWNTFNNTCDPMDDFGHGTHVSGTIGAVGNNGTGVTGVNWTTKIIAAKMCEPPPTGCPNSNAINALQFLEGAKFYFGGWDGGADIRVLSSSWGGAAFSQALLDEINNAYTADMLFAAAAGNNGSNNDTTPFYPASYSAVNIVAVGATDNQDNLASFSDYGANSVHLAGPGVNVYSTWWPGGGYQFESGTSMATPHVSGASALSLSVCQGDTEWLKPNILNNVVKIASLNGKTITGGRVNTYNSLHSGSTACPGTGDAWVSGNEQSRQVYQNGHWVTVYDSGSISLTVNGATKTVTYGQYSQARSLAVSLYDQINGDSNYPVRAHLVSSTQFTSDAGVSLSAKTTGTNTCYTMTTGYTYDTAHFYQPSFHITASGSSLIGCK